MTTQKLDKLVKEDGKLVVVPMDDGLLDGPVGGLKDMPKKVEQIVKGGADAMLGFLGVYKQCKDKLGDTGFVLNLTASTAYSMNPQQKVQIYDVAQAKAIGMSGVAVHINLGSVHLHDQMKTFGQVAADCERYDLPLLGIVYPRGEMVREDALVDATVYAARMAAEVGADVVKTKYFGKEAFAKVVEGCPIPVIMAGGPKAEVNPTETILQKVYDSVQVGGSGVAIGRNAFHHENTTGLVKALHDVVHDGKTVTEVMETYNLKN